MLSHIETLTCQQCGAIAEPYLWMQTHSDGREHLRADCPECDRYIKYVSQFDDPPPRFATDTSGYNTEPSSWRREWERLGSVRKPRYER